MQIEADPFVGAWRLVSFEFRREDGSVIRPFGEKARGSLMYTESGRYSAQLMRVDRPRFESGDQMKGSVEEIEASYKGSISYFGTYEVDLENGFIVHYVESSIFPNMEGTNQVRLFEFSGNRLLLRTPPMKLDGEKAVGVLIWEKVEQA
jgi:hypothetical protein